MKPSLIAGALLLLLCSSFQQAPPTFRITGRVMQTSEYCGGAAPDEQILNYLNTPQPVQHFKLYFKTGSTNSAKKKTLKTVETDDNGYFSVDLAPGTYCIVENYKSKPLVIPKNDEYTTWDAACLRQQYAQCDYSLKVTGARRDTVKINYYRHCSFSQPCQDYHGPLPPAAAPQNPAPKTDDGH